MMLKPVFVSTTLLALSGAALANTDYVNHGSHELIGAVQISASELVGVATLVDQLKTPGGKVYVQPEEYKLVTFTMPVDGTYPAHANFNSIPGKVSCSFDGPGIRAFTQKQVNHGIACSWKSNPGSNAEIKDFDLFLTKTRFAATHEEVNTNTPMHPGFNGKRYFRDYKVAGSQLKGTLEIDNQVLTDVFVPLDVADYRNGNSHKVFIRGKELVDGSKEKQKIRFDNKVTVDGTTYKIKLLGCSHDLRSAGSIDILVGKSAPTAMCEFVVSTKVKHGGWQYSPIVHTVNLATK